MVLGNAKSLESVFEVEEFGSISRWWHIKIEV